MRSSRFKRLIIGFGVLLVLALGVDTVYRAGPYKFDGHVWGSPAHRTDFTVYRAAGRAVLDGKAIYSVTNPRGWYFMYLPVVAVVMVPFALLSVFWGSLAWYVISVALLLTAAILSVKLARRQFPGCRYGDLQLIILILLLVAWPCVSGLARGQASVVLTGLTILGIWLAERRKEWLAGLSLAGAIALKVFPALLLVYYLAKGRWKMAVTTTVWLVLLVAVLPATVFSLRGNQRLLEQWVTTIVLPVNDPVPERTNPRYGQEMDPRIARNQSVDAVMARWSMGWNRQDLSHEPTAHLLSWIANLLLLLLSAWGCRGHGKAGEKRAMLEISVVLFLVLLISPVTWVHNCSLLLLPLAVMLAGQPKVVTWRLGLAAFGAGTVLAITVPLFLWLGFYLFGMLALWAVLTHGLIREQALENKARHFYQTT